MRTFIYLFSLIYLLCAAVTIAEEEGENSRQKRADMDPDVYLEKFGYLSKGSDGKSVQHSPAARQEGIRKFQEMMNLPVSGRLDSKTLEMMHKPRCGIPDVHSTGRRGNFPSRPAAFYYPGYKWKKNLVTWRLNNYSRDLPSGSQRRAVSNALKIWSEVTNLEFRETRGNADIEIKFARGYHEDGAGNSFDGLGGVLAHAFFPENGDTHFDEDEKWTEYSKEGTNFEIVAAHEFGHALGLGHTNIPGALMAPYYQGYTPNLKLHSDDIRGIQSIYGAKRGVTPRPPVRPTRPTPRPPVRPTRPTRPTRSPTTTTTRRPSVEIPDKCNTKFDAIILNKDGKYYAFRGSFVYKISYNGVSSGYPKMVRYVYPQAPRNLGAAVYSWRTRKTYFFKGRKLWKYSGFELERGYPKYIRNPAYPYNPEAALAWRDGRIYIFKGDNYWEFDEASEDITRYGYPKEISVHWPGISGNIEAAVWSRYERRTYFFRGRNYRKFNDYYRRVDVGYPKLTAPAWMGCGRKVPK